MSNFQGSSGFVFKYTSSFKISMYFYFLILLINVVLSFMSLKFFNTLPISYIKIIPCGVNFCFSQFTIFILFHNIGFLLVFWNFDL